MSRDKQFDLFGPAPTPDWRAEREEGMAKAEEHAAPDWKTAAREMIYKFACEREFFFGWEITIELRRLGIDTPTDRALGPMLVAAAKRGEIEKTERHDHNPLAHGCPSPCWRSRLRKAPAGTSASSEFSLAKK